MEPLQDEDEEQDEMKVFKTFNPRQYTFNAEVHFEKLDGESN